jgi:hypothetical protein
VGVLAAAVGPGWEEDADGERGDETSMVARSEGSRWSRAQEIARRSPLLRTVLRVAIVLLKRGHKHAPKHVRGKRREKRELEEEERRREEAGAHRNRRRKPLVSAGFGSVIRWPGGVSDAGKERGERGGGGRGE